MPSPVSDLARPAAPASRLRCRRIREADREAVVRLLVRGFPERGLAYWTRALDRLTAHAATLRTPDCGTLMEHDGDPVGVVLLIPSPEGAAARRNISSWYVEPAFQGYAPLLVGQALRERDVTFFNISPAPHTWRTIEAQGFARYGTGRMMVVPALARVKAQVRVAVFDPASPSAPFLSASERALLARHMTYGCLAVCVTAPDGTWPFLVLPRRIKGWVPAAHLVYCRDIADLVRFAGPLGRFLLRRGMPILAIDADGPLTGLPGGFVTDRIPKYFRGPCPPRLGDMTDTELVMFGP